MSSRDCSANPYLFVVGCPRSGTTLLQRILNHHSQLAVANDTHFIPRALELTDKSLINGARAGEKIALTDELVAAVRAYHRTERLELPDEAFATAAKQSQHYDEFVARLYDAHATLFDKPLAGEKTPDYVCRLPLLLALFPHARILHIIRDGRDVALSLLDWASRRNVGPARVDLWSSEPVAVCALWWAMQVTAGRTAGAAHGPQVYTEVSYEQLVHQPAVVAERLCAFLSLDYEPEMLAHFEHKQRRLRPGRSPKNAWLPPTAGLRNWVDEMPAADIELFEALAGDVLEELGYARHASAPSPDVADRARRCAEWWKSNIKPLSQA